jgi:hypothetical protein
MNRLYIALRGVVIGIEIPSISFHTVLSYARCFYCLARTMNRVYEDTKRLLLSSR